MKRTIEPEWLDELSSTDPLAIASRGDLRRLNHIMGHPGMLSNLLKSRARESSPQHIVELGSGDGTLMLRLARQFSAEWPQVHVTLVDRQGAINDATRRAFEGLGWPVEIISADVFEWLKTPAKSADIMFANLFLHHFSATQLTQLFGLAEKRTKVFAACEPRRAALPLIFSRLVGLIGCNSVTRHDAVISVRAGFAGKELSALWPKSSACRLRENRAGLFTHTFLAESAG